MKKNEAKKETNTATANQQLLNIITPSGISIEDNHASIGEGVGKIYCISRYPEDADYGWLAELVNLPGTATCIEYRYSSEDIMISAFNARISELNSLRDSERRESERQLYEKYIKDLKEIINRISVKKEPVGYFNIMLHIMGSNEEALNARIRKISGIVRTKECNLRHLKFRQGKALAAMSPWGRPDPEVSNVGERNMPMSTFIGGFPMAAAGLNDFEGKYVGMSKDRTVMLNMWLRGNDRTNSNLYIQGVPGTGKSTAIKLLQILEYALNDSIQVVWDAENEYLDIANNPRIDAEIIDCASGTSGRINPLQIRFTPRIEKEDLKPGEKISEFLVYEEAEDGGFSDMALHIQNLRQFFAIYFGQDNFKEPGIRKAFEKALIETYNRRGIYWDTDIRSLKNEDFPIISEFCAVAEEFSKRKELSDRERDNYERLGELLFSLGAGADQFLWNGYTTLNPKAKYIVLNVSKLLEMDDNIKNAQFFNLKMWEWHFLSSDREQKAVSCMDEGYLYTDPEYPALIKMTRNMSKRGRKYEVGLWFITHSLVDILDPAVKRFTQAIIDNSCYKLLFGTDGKNLEETAKLFKLTDKEITMLESKTRGKALLMAGSIRLELQVDVADEILAMMGSAGGR